MAESDCWLCDQKGIVHVSGSKYRVACCVLKPNQPIISRHVVVLSNVEEETANSVCLELSVVNYDIKQ